MEQLILIIVFAMYGWWMARGVKTQWVRLVDVFVYGPGLIYLALKSEIWDSGSASGTFGSLGGTARETSVSLEQLFLLFLGATTITYNARNYLLQ